MRRIYALFVLSILFSVAFISCKVKSNESQSLTLTRFEYSDSVGLYTWVSVSALLPMGNSYVEQNIRDTLLARIYHCFNEEFGVEPIKLNIPLADKNESVGNTLRGYVSETANRIAMYYVVKDQEYVNEDPFFVGYFRHDILIDTVSSEKDKHYVTFLFNNGQDCGGAHGVVWHDNLTFDCRTGKRFTNFFKSKDPSLFQAIIREGLNEHSYDFASIAQFFDGIIPLPKELPCPMENGLSFNYQYYEICGYGAGMPSFIVPYDTIKPLLTDEAIELLGL